MAKFLMCADLHFRSTVPEARLDDYLENQDKLIEWLRSYEEKGYIILCSGDVVHYPRERARPIHFANYLYNKLPKMIGALGNHDLLYHKQELLSETTMGLLVDAGKYDTRSQRIDNVELNIFHYGQEIEHTVKNKALETTTRIAIYHGMVTQEPNPFFEGEVAENLLDKFPEYDIILTGDNHEGFVVAKDDRVLINPGSLKRDTASQIEHKPFVYLFDSDTKKLEAVPVPIENDIISRDHLEKKQERDERLEKLSDKFVEVQDITLDYRQNIFEALKVNKITEEVELRLLKWME